MVLHSGQMGNAASNATGVKEEMKRVVSGFEDIVEKSRLATVLLQNQEHYHYSESETVSLMLPLRILHHRTFLIL